MFAVSYYSMAVLITTLWIIVRLLVWAKTKKIDFSREAALLFVYVCLVVVARFTFFPFDRVDGKILPLIFDKEKAYPFRINIIPFAFITDYPDRRSILLNIIGNTAMFIPIGIVWPAVFKKLDRPFKVIAAGIGLSLFIELLQLPFFDRVSDIDDLILNSLGYVLGYLIFLLLKCIALLFKRKRP